ncbi:hypothetical protein J437_LFUL017659 [Ladona fulva]|uniref:Nucleic-acid-binding protein from mobile element jockey n=1 Tax=Ladona fulva TaxID=123851 RepID=A0A8K0KQ14_LADFU|nr:hypothetical protein J437_LFUL017659 [Ladona fulva]
MQGESSDSNMEWTSVQNFLAVRYVCGLKIRIEKHRPPKGPPQCHRCQLFGHTDKACHMPPRCVKCGGNHLTADCKKEAVEAAVCAYCKGGHPASYRGCPVYAKLKQKLNYLKNKAQNKTKKLENLQVPLINGEKVIESNSEVVRSYAEAARGEGERTEQLEPVINNAPTLSNLNEEEITISGATNLSNEDDDWRVIMSKWISHLALLIVKPGLTRTGFISHVINSTHLLSND